MLTDYHTHLRPDVGGHAAGALLHRGQRPPLPRGGRGARRRRARLLRARVPLPARRSTSGATRSGRRTPQDDLDDYVDFVESMKATGLPVKLGIEMDWIPGREEQHRGAARRRGRGTTWSARCTSSPTAPWTTTATTPGTRRTRTGLERPTSTTLGDAAASGLFDILAHPDLVKVWGADGPRRRARGASTTSSRSSESPARTWRSRSRRPGCASRSGEIYPAPRAAGDVRRRRASRSRSRRTRTSPSTSATGTTRPLELPARRAGSTGSACSTAARRSEEPLG